MLIAAAAEWPGEEGVRLRCIVELLYAAGLRVSELVELSRAHVTCAFSSCAARETRSEACHWASRRAGRLAEYLEMSRRLHAASLGEQSCCGALAIPVSRRRRAI